MWLVGITSLVGNLPFRLERGIFEVGRSRRTPIVIAESTVSRQHARLTCTAGALRIEDLGSANGTFVNEVAVTESLLTAGDVVRFGSVPCAISPTPRFAGRAMDDDSTYQIPPRNSANQRALAEHFTFTAAQLRIIPYLMQGKSEPQIAVLLAKSPHTIHTQIRAIFEIAGVHSREELIVQLMQHGSSEFTKQ